MRLMSRSRPILLASTLLLVTSAPRRLAAQALEDNSFLVEEAYNQPARVVQHVFTTEMLHGSQVFGFGQEWPLGGPTHQLSYSLVAENDASFELGDAELNYRWQAMGGEGAKLFVAPRLSALVPLGDADRWGGNGGFGVEAQIPVSWQASRFVSFHANAGAAWRPSAENALGASAATLAPSVGVSAVIFVTPKFNLMAESVWDWERAVVADGETAGTTSHAIALGARVGIDLPSGMQIVPGAAWMPSVDDAPTRSFLYLSIEHGF
jgi:hypothetical protein